MRIWLLAENWPPRIGGIERYLTGIARHVPEHEVTVIAPLHPLQLPLGKGESTTSPLLTKERLGEVSIVYRRFFYPMWPKWLPLYLFLAKKVRQEKPDLIICGKALFEGRLALKLKKKFDIPYVVCTYGMEIATWSLQPRIRWQLQKTLKNADKVLYINTKTKEELLALGTPEENLMLLYPGVDITHLTARDSIDDVLKKYAIQKPYILTIARLIKRKGIDDLIEAFALYTGEKYQLAIVGDGPEREALEHQAKKLHVNVIFTGSIPDEELHALYTGATLYALTPKELPGDYEGFGIVYSEAAYFGLPVVATKTGGVSESVEDGVTGILAEANNPASIAKALETLLADYVLAKQYGEAGRQRVLDRFTWDRTMKNFNEYLTNV